MTIVFHEWWYDRFIEIQSNLRRKKLHRMNKATIFLEAVLVIEIMQEPQSNYFHINSTTVIRPIKQWMLKSPKTNTLAEALTDRTSSMLDELESKSMHKDESD